MKGRKGSDVICGKNERRHVTNSGEMTETNFSILSCNPMEADSEWGGYHIWLLLECLWGQYLWKVGKEREECRIGHR